MGYFRTKILIRKLKNRGYTIKFVDSESGFEMMRATDGKEETHICYSKNYADTFLSDFIKELDDKNKKNKKLKAFEEFR